MPIASPTINNTYSACVCLSVYPSICLSVSLSVCPSIYLSIHPSIRLSIHPSIYLSSIYPSPPRSFRLTLVKSYEVRCKDNFSKRKDFYDPPPQSPPPPSSVKHTLIPPMRQTQPFCTTIRRRFQPARTSPTPHHAQEYDPTGRSLSEAIRS